MPEAVKYGRCEPLKYRDSSRNGDIGLYTELLPHPLRKYTWRDT